MRIYKSPQVRLDDKRIDYSAKGDKLTVTIEGVSDTFDFTNVVGVLNMVSVRTTLSFNPIQKVERKNGNIEVTTINYIGQNATDEERFPQYIEEAPVQGFYLPKWNGTEWVEGGQAPEPTVPKLSTDEKLTQMAEQLIITQTELEVVQEALDFLLLGGI